MRLTCVRISSLPSFMLDIEDCHTPQQGMMAMGRVVMPAQPGGHADVQKGSITAGPASVAVTVARGPQQSVRCRQVGAMAEPSSGCSRAWGLASFDDVVLLPAL